MSRATQLQISLNAQRRSLENYQKQQAAAQASGDTVRVQELAEAIAEQEQSITLTESKLETARAEESIPAQSTGQTTANEQQGRAGGALPQNPPVANDDAPTPTNATTTSTAPTTGVNGDLRPSVNTQGTPPIVAAPGGIPGDADAQPGGFYGTASADADAQPGGFYGAAAPSDDSGAGLNPVAQQLKKLYGGSEDIKPKANPLDRCASYTYNISMYLTTPSLYSGLITNKKKSVSGMSLILRSGGTSQAVTLDPQEMQQVADGQSAAMPGASRNNSFPLDLYVDNLQIKSVINGKGTMSPHSSTEINFRVIEPNGITFIQNLQKATKQLALATGDVDNAYLSQVYLMVIRFYGWDENGNPVAPETNIAAQQSDRTAITEKFIPFIFTGIKFKIANRLTEYDCSAVAVGNMIGTGQQRGTLPSNFQVTSSTLKGALKELETALNKFQQDLCSPVQAQGPNKKQYTWPDVYEFQLVPPLDGDSITLSPPGSVLNTQTAMNPSAKTNARSVLPDTQAVKSTTKINPAFAGMSIIQFLDQMVRQSGYIYQQQKYIYDPQQKNTAPKVQTGVGKLMAWYRIAVQAVPDLQKWDPRRRDYAYKITYQISPYLVTDVLSDYFPQSPRWTAPKEYQYWFTGQNNSILDFTQDLNNLYYFVVNAPQSEVSDSQLKNESKKGYQPASNISSAGMPGRVNEPGANAAQYLYSPADLARARMIIIGDPDWIQQGDIWAGITSPSDFDPAPIYSQGPDAGGINYGGRETLFDIVFKTPADYDLNTGLITDPGASQPGSTINGMPQMLEQRARYKAITVVNNFSQGRFTQEIEGVLIIPDVAKDTQKTVQKQSEKTAAATSSAPAPAAPDQSDAETRRLQNAANQARFGGKTFAEKQQSAATTMQAARRSSLFNPPTSAPYLPASDPTSGTNTVGTTTSGSLFGQYGATGVGTGNPAVTFTTNTGRVITATSDADIRDAFNQGYINKITQNNLTRQLNTLQQQASNSKTSANNQVGNREP